MRAKGTLANTMLKGKVEVETSRGRPARQRLDDAKEWTMLSLNEMWREPEDRVAWGKHVSRVVPNGLSMRFKIREDIMSAFWKKQSTYKKTKETILFIREMAISRSYK